MLGEIRANPLEQIKSELSLLEAEDPISSEFLSGLVSLYPDQDTAVMEGFTWTRKIIKKNASLSGQQMPILTREGRTSYLASLREKAKKGEKLDGHTLTQLREIEESDTEIGRGLRELSQYRVDNIQFLFGAVSAYQALKRMHDSDKLSAALKF